MLAVPHCRADGSEQRRKHEDADLRRVEHMEAE